jgi:hypothetical protein
MRISYSAIWEDTVRLLRAHASLAAALAGVFFFLPALLIGHFLPMPQASDANEMLRQFIEHVGGNIHWMLLSTLATAAGTLAILFLIFRSGGISVGAAITAAFGLLLPYVLAFVPSMLAIGLGLGLFIIPGLYLAGRLTPLAPVMVAENERNPLAALGRTWRLTKGHGWAIFGLALLVFVAGLVLSAVVGGLIGLVLLVAFPEGLARFLSLIVTTATSTAVQVVMLFLYAAIYRALAGRPAAAESAVPAPPATVRSDGHGEGRTD